MSAQSAPAETPGAAAEADPWPPLELYDIRKRWHKDRALIDGVNLTLEPGKAVWLGVKMVGFLIIMIPGGLLALRAGLRHAQRRGTIMEY